MSYDDGVRQDGRLIAIMKKYSIKGTFNLNSGRLGINDISTFFGKHLDLSTFAPEEIADIYKGFEISTHGVTHSSLANIGALACTELIEDRKALEALTGALVQGHALPYGRTDSTTETVLKAAGIRYCRTITSTHAFDLPEDFLAWNPTCHHTEECLMELGRQFCEKKGMFKEPCCSICGGIPMSLI